MAESPSHRSPRRRPFTAIRKGLIAHVLSGRLRGTSFAVYVWLHMQADHTTGIVRTNAGRLAAELGLHPVTVRRDLGALRHNGYVRYESVEGSRQLYEIAIEKYHRNFEDAATAQPEPAQVPLQAPLHERAGTTGNHGRSSAPKNKEVRSRRTTTLRVRTADPDTDPKNSSKTPETGSTPALTRSAAIAQAPAILRETLELFFLKTGREGLAADELGALAELERAHTPAVIQKAITTAGERFARRGQPPGEVTLHYVWDSLRRFTTRRPPGSGPSQAAADGVPARKYPEGVTRIWLTEADDDRDPITKGPEDPEARDTRGEAREAARHGAGPGGRREGAGRGAAPGGAGDRADADGEPARRAPARAGRALVTDPRTGARDPASASGPTGSGPPPPRPAAALTACAVNHTPHPEPPRE
jgi:DNA-binding transcriptional ArsR family regulator